MAFLAEPRHLLAANNRGPVAEQSDGPFRAGSWFVMAFDQLRVRVEYTRFEPPQNIAATLSWTGRGSRNLKGIQEFALSELGGGMGTRIAASVEGEGGPIRWGPFLRATQALNWRRLRRMIESSA